MASSSVTSFFFSSFEPELLDLRDLSIFFAFGGTEADVDAPGVDDMPSGRGAGGG